MQIKSNPKHILSNKNKKMKTKEKAQKQDPSQKNV